MAMAEENNNSLMLVMGRSLLDLNNIESFDSIVQKIKNITSDDLLEIAEEMFDDSNFSFIYFVPKKKIIQTNE